MNWLDGIILAILALSVLIGLMRGLVAEVLSLATWIAAFWMAAVFGPDVAALFQNSISLPMARIGLGYAICFFGILLLGMLVRFAARRLIWSTGLTGVDRVLGVLFGFVRGALVVTILVFLVGLTAVTREPWWQQSVLLPQFQVAAAWLGQNIPASVGDHLHPDAVLDKLKSAPVLPHGPAGSSTAPSLLERVAPAELLKRVDGLSERLHAPISGRQGAPAAPASAASTPPPARQP
ncbi:CvpA family protein [Rhodanobacter sp. UC4451_H18]|jgi:membrane protein required for colicin V production